MAGQEGPGNGGRGKHTQAQGQHSLGFLSPQVRGEAPYEVMFSLLQLQGCSALDVADEPALLSILHLVGAWRGEEGAELGCRSRGWGRKQKGRMQHRTDLI